MSRCFCLLFLLLQWSHSVFGFRQQCLGGDSKHCMYDECTMGGNTSVACIQYPQYFAGTCQHLKINADGTRDNFWSNCPLGNCIAGYFISSTEDGVECMYCSAGQYTSAPNQARQCRLCEAGKYATYVGNTGCTPCPRNTDSLPGSSFCTACPAGKFSNDFTGNRCTSSTACTTKPPSIWNWYAKSGCTTTKDAVWERRGKPSPCTVTTLPNQPNYSEWMSAKYKCKPGQYLRGFTSDEEKDKDCRECPKGMVGRNGQYCEWCSGQLEEPHWLDQSLCVCKAGAVMDGTGQCVCPDGRRYNQSTRACDECPINTYGSKGECFDCGSGNFTSTTGATACVLCAAGKYRVAGVHINKGCQACAQDYSYAPDPTVAVCVPCNQTCSSQGGGWRETGPCPGVPAALLFKVCAPCEFKLPSNAKWIGQGGGCVYECDAGYYLSTAMECAKCSTEPCPAGYTGSACGVDQDRGCEDECRNESKPMFNSKWGQASTGSTGPAGACPWECVEGYEAVETDYWMFRVHECVRKANR